jgi:hypothetical protein
LVWEVGLWKRGAEPYQGWNEERRAHAEADEGGEQYGIGGSGLVDG